MFLGFCDVYVYVMVVMVNLYDLFVLFFSLVIVCVMVIFEVMLMCGFIIVCDVGGCDWGFVVVVVEGII